MAKMINEIKELIKEKWRITIEQSHWGIATYADRGDFNCPHKRQYDPKDGHGLSQVWAEGFEHEEPSKTLEESINKLHTKCKAVIPGAKYKSKSK